MNILIIISIILTLSFWSYCDIFYRMNILPYRIGYLIFALFQFILVLINFIWIWGWIIGIVATIGLFTLGNFIIGNITDNIYKYFKLLPSVGLALFSTFVWIIFILTIIKLIIQIL